MMQIARRITALAVAVWLCGCSALPTTPVMPGESAARLRALRAAAEDDNGLAQAQLGVLYFQGDAGVSRDLDMAHRWFLRAADSGCPASQLYLGLMHLSGEHVPKDLDRAAYWLRLAADQGQVALEDRLLQMHRGEIPLRLRVAYEWVRDPLGAPPGPAVGD